ncbi:MAG: heme NO-binding domain-containing protein, partial [Bacteroidota bacterium]
MKGIVFTELLEMVEQEFGYETVDDLLENTDLPSGGIYTAVGTYDHAELETIVGYLSDKSGIKVHDRHYQFGYYLFGTFQ